MILFIDDEVFFNESYNEELKEAGYVVLMVRDVNEAIEVFTKKISEIQLVILDIMFEIPENLPKGFNIESAKGGTRSGIEVIRLLNEIPGGREIPKIILTNVADENIHNEFKNSNVVKGCYRKKDVNIYQLNEIVSNIIGGGI